MGIGALVSGNNPVKYVDPDGREVIISEVLQEYFDVLLTNKKFETEFNQLLSPTDAGGSKLLVSIIPRSLNNYDTETTIRLGTMGSHSSIKITESAETLSTSGKSNIKKDDTVRLLRISIDLEAIQSANRTPILYNCGRNNACS